MVCSLAQLVDEDEGDGDGGYPADEEEEGDEEPAGKAYLVVVRQLVDDRCARQAPAHKDAQHDAAQGHDP